jgi:hypothetical protein
MSEYSITELANFAETVRDSAASNLSGGQYDTRIIDTFITIEQVISIVKKESLGLDNDGKFIVNGTIFDDVFEQVTSIIYQAALSKVASQDLIECAWDDEKNKMIFWVEDNSKHKKNIDPNPF